MNTPLIKGIKVRNFRGIREGELKLSPLTILIGPNNSGKTTILEALLLSHGIRELFKGVSVPKLLMELHEVLGSRSLKHLIYTYSARAKRACIEYNVNGKTSTLIILLVGSRMNFYVVNAGIDQAMEIGDKKLKSLNILASLGHEGGGTLGAKYLTDALFIRYDILRKSHEFLYSVWEELTYKGLTCKVAEWISKAVSEDFTDLTAEPFAGKSCIYLYRSDKVRIRLSDLGDGAHMLVVARLLVDYLNPNLILWDDIESHMNPRMLSLLAYWLADLVDNGKQVVLTTHSLEAVETISRIVENASIVRLSLVNGILEARYLDVNEVNKLKKLGIDART